MSGRGTRLAAGMLVLMGGAAGVVSEPAPPEPSLSARLEPQRATVGDPLVLQLTLELPADAGLSSTVLGPELGPFRVLEGQWEPVRPEAESHRRVWSGRVAAYETGELEFPAVSLEVRLNGASTTVHSEPIAVRIESVLAEDEAAELAGIKDPVSLPADYRALRIALAVILALLVVSLAAWWVTRRLAPKLAARPLPADPFERTPPHEWFYSALQELLQRRLAERGQVTAFYGELAWIVKRYLGGRYRVDLMERTTSEVADALAQAGAPGAPVRDAVALLERSDRVKFARQPADAEQCRREIEEAYRVVDATRPAEARKAEPHAETA